MLKALTLLAMLSLSLPSYGTAPPANGGKFPDAYFDRVDAHPQAFTYKRALYDVAARATTARVLGASSNLFALGEKSQFSNKMLALLGVGGGASLAGAGALAASPEFVSGVRSVPVLLTYFPETPAKPYPAANLQRELFDGPWPSGTMSQYYTEISNGALTLNGTVRNWVRLGKGSAYYVGVNYLDKNGKLAPCFGLCNQSRVGEFVQDALRATKGVDWAKYDNDGPDGIPNSGDDDGFVDFVAFVQPNSGSECQDNPGSIWSHRSSLTSWGRKEFTTTTPRKGGGFIQIDDYVIMPAFACDQKTMIQIGVFAHEFGHAFGLPDLYDTDPSDGSSAGLGYWCLMAAGSWGALGGSPETPAPMSPWAKAYLGWITVKDIEQDNAALALQAIEDSRVAYRVNISPKLYYLLNATRRTGFNRNAPAEGMQIWRVNDTALKAGLRNNRVNAVNSNRGVALIEADGRDRMASDTFRGDGADIFPGTSMTMSFDSTAHPASDGRVSVCDIVRAPAGVTAAVYVSRNVCGAHGPVVVAAGPLLAGGPAAAPPAPPAPPASGDAPPAGMSVAQAASAPQGSRVKVTGTLINAGWNLFDRKTRRLVLVSKSGEEIDVAPQMVLERPADLGAKGGPASLSSLLDKEVTIDAVVARSVHDQTLPALQATSIEIK